jgi:hypothetical protein
VNHGLYGQMIGLRITSDMVGGKGGGGGAEGAMALSPPPHSGEQNCWAVQYVRFPSGPPPEY